MKHQKMKKKSQQTKMNKKMKNKNKNKMKQKKMNKKSQQERSREIIIRRRVKRRSRSTMKRWIRRRNSRDKKSKAFEKVVLLRQKGQNLWNCSENAVLGYLKPYKQKPATTKNQRTKQKQVWVEQRLQHQSLQQQRSTTTSRDKQQINNMSQTDTKTTKK